MTLARELDAEVDELLEAGEDDAGDHVARIGALAAWLLEAGRVEPLADAVLRLAMVPGDDPPAPWAAALARRLLVPDVADRLVARLGVVRDPGRREVLGRTLGALGAPIARAAHDALSRTESRSARHALTELLALIGEDGAGVLRDMIRDDRWYVVRNAVMVLGESRAEWAVTDLGVALRHEDPRVRREAVLALARVGSGRVDRGVAGMLRDPDERVREAAALAAGTLRIRSAVPDLLERLEASEPEEVTIAVIRALGRIGDAQALDGLEARLGGARGASTEVRVAACRALADVGSTRARAIVSRAAEDRDETVRTAARELLRDWSRS